MRKTIQISLIVLALASSIRAGEIPNMIVDPPPPPPPAAQAAGEMQNGLTTQSAATAIAVELLQALMSLA